MARLHTAAVSGSWEKKQSFQWWKLEAKSKLVLGRGSKPLCQFVGTGSQAKQVMDSRGKGPESRQDGRKKGPKNLRERKTKGLRDGQAPDRNKTGQEIEQKERKRCLWPTNAKMRKTLAV